MMFFKKENEKEKQKIAILNFSDILKIDNKIKRIIKEKFKDINLTIYKKYPSKEFEVNDIIRKNQFIIVIVDKRNIIDYSFILINEHFGIIKNGEIKIKDIRSEIIKKFSNLSNTIIIAISTDTFDYMQNAFFKEKFNLNLLKAIENIINYLKSNTINELFFKDANNNQFTIKRINFYLSHNIFLNSSSKNSVEQKILILKTIFNNKNVAFDVYDLDKIFNGEFENIIDDNETINIIIFTKDYDKYINLFIFEKETTSIGYIDVIKKIALNYDYINNEEIKTKFINFINFFSKLKNIFIIKASKITDYNNNNYMFFTSDIEAIYNNAKILKKYFVDNIKDAIFIIDTNEFRNYLLNGIKEKISQLNTYNKTIESYIKILQLSQN